MEVIIALLLGLVVLPAANAGGLVGPVDNGAASVAVSDAKYVRKDVTTTEAMNGSLSVAGSAFSVGGSTLVVANGSVSIGGTAPTFAKFTVSRDGTDGIEIDPGNTSGVIRSLYYSRSTSAYKKSLNLASEYEWQIGSAKAMGIATTGAVDIPGSSFSVGTSTLVVSGGNVSLSASGQPEKLYVNGDVKFVNTSNSLTGLTLSNTGATFNNSAIYIPVTRAASTAYKFIDARANGVVQHYVDGSGGGYYGGNVGIGTTAPQTKMHISSSTLTMDGTGSPTAGYALCFQANKQMGKCTTAVAADGTCTCGTP